jgi:hypothetical protein
LLPSDQQLELEYWAESGEFDSNELHEVSTDIFVKLVISGTLAETWQFFSTKKQ